jgi:hypothetical protein
MRKSFLLSLASSLALAALLSAPEAHAQSSDPAAAQGLFDAAKQLVAQHKFADACPKFVASFRLDPKPGTMVNLADCYEKSGQTASAWARYLEAASLAQRAGQAEREKYAKDHAAALEPKIARLTISAAASARGLEVLRDGAPIDAAILGTPVPIDPGTHQIEARAPGKKPWTKTIDIAAGPTRVTVDVPSLEDMPQGAPLPVGSVTGPVAPQVEPVAPPPQDTSLSTRKKVGYAAIAAGGAGVLVGIITGSMAISKHGSLASSCPHGVCVGQDSAISSYHTLGTVADVGLFVGGAIAVTGIVLVATAPSASPAKQGWIRPVVGPGFTGAMGRF